MMPARVYTATATHALLLWLPLLSALSGLDAHAQPTPVAQAAPATPSAGAASPSPLSPSSPPSTASAAEEPEPPPAPLLVDPVPAAAPTDLSARPRTEVTGDAKPRAAAPPSPRAYTAAAWSGVALTLALVVTGTTLGVLSQSRSDELSRHTGQTVDGLPPVYDAAQADRYVQLQSDGASFNRGTIVCLLLAGVSAIGTGVLFWDRQRLFGKDLVLAPAVSPTDRLATVSLTGRF